MIELFKRKLSTGYFIPEMNRDVNWFLNEKTIATREYNGHLLRHTEEGWEYYRPIVVHEADDQTVLGYESPVWNRIYPKVSYFKQALQIITNTWSNRNSTYLFVDEFEKAESPFTEEYEFGEYWLVPQLPGEQYLLVPVNKAEQLSNINELDLHTLKDTATVFDTLQEAMLPLRHNLYGVIFTTADGRRTRVRPQDFDWTQYDAES